jgi:hypothetical protein
MLDFTRTYRVARNLPGRDETAATEKLFKRLLLFNAGAYHLKPVCPGAKTESITQHLFSTKREGQGFAHLPLSFFCRMTGICNACRCSIPDMTVNSSQLRFITLPVNSTAQLVIAVRSLRHVQPARSRSHFRVRRGVSSRKRKRRLKKSSCMISRSHNYPFPDLRSGSGSSSGSSLVVPSATLGG